MAVIWRFIAPRFKHISNTCSNHAVSTYLTPFHFHVSKPIRPLRTAIPIQISDRSRLIVSCLMLFHFGAIGLTYATNWRRSAIQDRVLVWLQPYLISANWYQEMLPIEWISDANSERSLRVSVQTNDPNSGWKTVLDSSQNTFLRSRTERLLHPLVEFATSEDAQGLTNLLKSVVLHLENERNGSDSQILRIRLEKIAKPNVENEAESVLYEASLARFPNGEFGFVPKIESHRAVRAIESVRRAP